MSEDKKKKKSLKTKEVKEHYKFEEPEVKAIDVTDVEVVELDPIIVEEAEHQKPKLTSKKIHKSLKRQAKAEAKVAKLLNKPRKIKKVSKEKPHHKTRKSLDLKQAKKSLFNKKDLKTPKDKEPRNLKLAFKEFPVKMVKEVGKIKWSSRQNLFIKFIQVVIFILIAAILFYFIDLGLQELFSASRII